MAKEIVETDRFLLFWSGWPSQWHPARFVVGGVGYNCCEQYMMAEKARVFGDAAVLAKILASSSPRDQKAFGRKVHGFDGDVWNGVCRGIVYAGNLARFGQDDEMRRTLLATGERTIIEASPVDRIWGVGLAPDDPRAQDPSHWRGTNWLGLAQMQVRDALRRSTGANLGEPRDAELIKQLRRRATLDAKARS